MTEKLTSAYQIINFSDQDSADGSGYGGSITVELDDDQNLDENGNAKSSFLPDGSDQAALRVLDLEDSVYAFKSSGGGLQQLATNVPYEFEEQLIFPETKEAYLRHIPNGAIEWEWIGNDPGVSPVFDGRTVTLSEGVVGILKCTYTSLGVRLGLRSGSAIDILVVVTQEDNKGYCSVTFEDAEDGETVIYDIKVLDYCTDEPVENATVTLNGEIKGVTSPAGILRLGELVKGEHSLKIEKTGYQSSDVDKLNNSKVNLI